MNIYIASHDQGEARALAYKLRRRGYCIVSSWITERDFGKESYTWEECHGIALRDSRDVAICDVLVLLAGPDLYPGGKFVETGLALGLTKRIVILGRRENMLLWHPLITAVDNYHTLLSVLSIQSKRLAKEIPNEPV